MKARLPKKREFVIAIDEHYEKADECWAKLQEILDDYKAQGKDTYSKTFIEDNEAKVKALQEIYEFTYTIEEK